MTFQEKRTLVSFITTTLISLIYFAYVLQRYQTGNIEPANLFSFWGAAILIFVPVQVVFKLIVYVLFIIINTVARQEKEPSVVDELDKLVDLKATRNFYHVFMVGFMLSMLALVLNLPPLAMFIGLSCSMVVAGATLDLSQLYFYRRGI